MLKKVLLVLIALLVTGDALLLHGRYRAKVVKEAEVAEQTVREQDWSTPHIDEAR
jgi:hypothetical protein